MTPQDLQSLFALRGIRTRIKGNEVQVGDCIFCGNPKYNLEINPVSGFVHAWCCGARGRADKFIRDHLGREVTIEPQVLLSTRRTPISEMSLDNLECVQPLASERAIRYLRERGIDAVDERIYQILEGKGPSWEGRVVFPLREYWTSEFQGFIGRAVHPMIKPKYFAHWNSKKVVTGYRSRSSIHVVVEGVFDGIAVHQAGFNAAVLGGVHESDIAGFAARVPEDAHIVVMLDADAQAQAEKLRWTILPVHSRVVMAPLSAGLDPAVLDRTVIQRLISSRTTTC